MAIIKLTEEEAAALNDSMNQDSRHERRDAIALWEKDPEAAEKKYPWFEDLFKTLSDPKK